MVRRGDDQPSLKLRPDKEDAAQRSPAGAGFTKPSILGSKMPKTDGLKIFLTYFTISPPF